MKMKNKLLFFTMMVMMSALAGARSVPVHQEAYPTTAWTTRGPGVNLKGKMFTLSGYRGGICFFSPYRLPPWYSTSYPSTKFTTAYYRPSTKPTTPYYTQTTQQTTPYYTQTTQQTTPYYTQTTQQTTPYYTQTTQQTTPYYTQTTQQTTPYYTQTTQQTTPYYTPTTKATSTPRPRTTSTYPPWTTAPTTRGLSVCFRYITDYLERSGPSIFTLSPSSTPLRLDVMDTLSYSLTFNNYNSMYLKPNIRLWSDLEQSMWTSICLTLDSVKGVAQMFSNTNMSMRKMLPSRYVWSGEPVIDFTYFEGQVTDVELWDYPLRYKEVLYYMSRGNYGSYQGSVLTWSNISYSRRGNVLLEDTYEQQIKEPANREAQGHRLKGKKMRREFVKEGKRNEMKKQLI